MTTIAPVRPAAEPLPEWATPAPRGVHWDLNPLVEIFAWQKEGNPKPEYSRAWGTEPPRDSGSVFRYAGRDFGDAVVAAAQLTRADANSPAQALLQAEDGSYFLTHLSHPINGATSPDFTRQTSRLYEAVDGKWREHHGDIVPLRLVDQVRAVIGGTRFWDLRTVGDGASGNGIFPEPLPDRAPPAPGELPRSVGTIRYQPAKLKVEPKVAAEVIADPAAPNAPHWQWAGRDFQGAVGEAVARARAAGGGAQAVLQGADGAMYLAHLGFDTRLGLHEKHGATYIDRDWLSENGLSGATALVKDPRVQAIVGADSWIDLRADA